MDAPYTISLADFWGWLVTHPNCILRSGTPDMVLFDDEFFHWSFATDSDGTLLVQLLHGKRILGELFVEPDRVDYVQAVASDIEDEHTFELMFEGERGPLPVYFFVLTHAYESQDETDNRVH